MLEVGECPLRVPSALNPVQKLILAVSELGAGAVAAAAAVVVVVVVVVVFVRSKDTLVHTPCAHRVLKQPVRKPYARVTIAYARLRAHLFMLPLVWLALRWFRSLRLKCL